MQIMTADQYSRGKRTQTIDPTVEQNVKRIINEVQKNKDQAIKQYTQAFDHVDLDSLTVSDAEFQTAKSLVDESFLQAIQQSIKNITTFHEQQQEKSWFMTKNNGIMLGQHIQPIEKVGVYIPGGKAAYPSTVVMNVIPAKIAGVPNISLVTPPQKDGTINPYVLVTAQLTGVDHVYKVGGAQAIAALAYGTETIERVDKIVGPGNDYVEIGRKFDYGDVAIDMIAGPSEICVIADHTASAIYVAADLLSQAEHDEAAEAICITTSFSIAENIQAEIKIGRASCRERV